ncbi:MAG: hypothetical protein KatS3mg002_1534 [Candidatus Woesearchaeota archaeon]|nr:MAG: hypothetical protein KatS3mg002_1534 [Candidatus Woesearchaeota archaeon]
MKLLSIIIVILLSVSFVSAETCFDNDEDGYLSDECGGTDCNDNNPNSWQVGVFWVDNDLDGYYLSGLTTAFDDGRISVCYGSEIPEYYIEETQGPDCDDNNNLLTTNCEIPEFSVIAAGLALIGALGTFVLIRKK